MVATSQFSEVPVVNVTTVNIKEIWPSLALAVKTSTFVALDLELSGLGNKKLLNERSLPDRYKNIAEVAKTRSILSMGLSCFKLQAVEQSTISKENSSKLATPGAVSDSCGSPEAATEVPMKQWSFTVQTFNVVLLCSEDYLVEPGTLKFLVQHGFDFNKQYASGVTYYRGKERLEKESIRTAGEKGPTARNLFDLLLWSQVPVVLHNGFVDLVFLYQNFYTDLPATLQVFLADLEEMFPQGILDTKYAVEFVDRLPATYLEYVFRKWQRKNALQACQERREVCLEFSRLPVSMQNADVSPCFCGLPLSCVEKDFIPKAAVLQDLVCQSFAGHGWCGKGKQCPKSHAIDLILDLDGIKAAKGRKRRRKQRDTPTPGGKGSSGDASQDFTVADCHMDADYSVADGGDARSVGENFHADDCSSEMTESEITDAYLESSQLLEESRSGGHRAGFDAFMTGFVLACLLNKHCSLQDVEQRVVGAGIKLSQLSGLEGLTNKIYAAGKDQPMIVSKSNFCNPSKNHRERIQKLRKS